MTGELPSSEHLRGIEVLAAQLWRERFSSLRGYPTQTEQEYPTPFRSWAHQLAYEQLGPAAVVVSCDNIEPNTACPSCAHEMQQHDSELGCKVGWAAYARSFGDEGCPCALTFAGQHRGKVFPVPPLDEQIEAKRGELAAASRDSTEAAMRVSALGVELDELLRVKRERPHYIPAVVLNASDATPETLAHWRSQGINTIVRPDPPEGGDSDGPSEPVRADARG